MELETLVQQPVFETERFVLRPVQRSDAGLIEFHTCDIRVARQTISIPHPLPPGATQSFIDRCLTPNREEDVWVIDGTPNGWSEVVGLGHWSAWAKINRNWAIGLPPHFETKASPLRWPKPLSRKTQCATPQLLPPSSKTIRHRQVC